MKKTIKVIIALVILLVAIGIISGCGSNNNQQASEPGRVNNQFNGTRNFQLNESQISEINSFFNSNPSPDEVKNYCVQNMANCAYYCRNINPNNDVCKELGSYNGRPGNFTRNGNYTGRPPGENTQ